MVLFIGGIGLVGFVATRLFGAGHGLVVTGLVGGLASSTAVTFTMARRAKENPALVCSCALAIVGASCVMLVRVLIAATLLFPALGVRIGAALVVMFAVSLLAAWPLMRGARAESKASAAVDVKNPFELKSAFVFGLAFAVVILLSKFLRATFGDSALYLAALVAGLTDVDAITLSTANLAKDGLSLSLAAGVILTACLSNTFVKIAIGWSTGGRALGQQLARIFGAMLAAGIVAVVVSALL